MISKKKFYPLLFLAVLFSFAAGAYAADGIEKVEAYLRPDFRIELDELPVVLDPPPLLYEGRTYLPIRVISELLGAKIDWDQSTFTVKIVSPRNPCLRNRLTKARNFPAILHIPGRFIWKKRSGSGKF